MLGPQWGLLKKKALAMMSFTFRPLQLLAVELGLGAALGDDLRVRGGVERAGRDADAGGAVVEGQSVAGVELGEVHHVDFLGAKPARKKA